MCGTIVCRIGARQWQVRFPITGVETRRSGLPIRLRRSGRPIAGASGNRPSTLHRDVNAWITPSERMVASTDERLLSPREGKCTDYAITMRHDLLALGWSGESLLLAAESHAKSLAIA